MKIEELTEGVHDPDIFKAVFVLGGPGSGKTYVSRRIAAGTGLKPLNLDDIYELLVHGPYQIAGKGYEEDLRRYSGALMQKRMDLYVKGRLGLLIDGTGRKVRRLEKTKSDLEELGYQTLGIFVNTELDVARERNERRPRKVDVPFLVRAHADLKRKIGDLQRIFNNRLMIIDNTHPENVDFTYYQEQLSKFLRQPVTNPTAQEWIDTKS